MPDFVRWANELGANATFWKLLDSQINKETFKKLNVFDTEHPEYNNLCKIVKHTIFRTGNCCIPDGVLNLQKVNKSFIKNISDIIKYARI